MRSIDEILKDMKALGTSPERIDRDIAALEAELKEWVRIAPNGKITFSEARKNVGLSHKQVSEKTGIPVSRIKKYEENNQKMHYPTFRKLCDLYGISVDHIYIGVLPAQNKNHLNMSLAGR
ncbi:helix-turn-helix domain-containing protein [Paenibacillus popilliae]|uniref:Predicted transcriptional regulator n=1 Tax=Paenibacillus popilliae ATCC 14706 TaxID=1212764 RepID=M9LQV6_PAEPP|nr:helix-turn-helix transcriptional regulator [Paenibacillus popilliae]GAC43471.1 predicted transcriptional regulator [Paenibacillus popilliae ATCC 14706]